MRLPAVERLLGGPLTKETLDKVPRGAASSTTAVFKVIDACLGVEGLPQSATGQATLFTGHNAPQLIGRHVPALPGAKLRSLIEQHSIFKQLVEHDLACTFANAFTERFFEYLKQPRRRRPSASLTAALAGGVRLRNEQDLQAGEALSWDITGEYFGVPLPQLRTRADRDRLASSPDQPPPIVDPKRAGRRLHALAGQFDFTLFETFVTDLAGHGRYVIDSRAALERVDGLVNGLLAARLERGAETDCSARARELTVVMTSDHGNVEDESTRLHTRNSVPLICWGPGASEFESVASLVDVAPTIQRWVAS